MEVNDVAYFLVLRSNRKNMAKCQWMYFIDLINLFWTCHLFSPQMSICLNFKYFRLCQIGWTIFLNISFPNLARFSIVFIYRIAVYLAPSAISPPHVSQWVLFFNTFCIQAINFTHLTKVPSSACFLYSLDGLWETANLPCLSFSNSFLLPNFPLRPYL